MLLMGGSSAFEWPCCVCSQTRLGPGPRQQGRQVQEVGFPTWNEVEGGRRPVCTSAARKIGVPLARARDGVPQQAWLPWLCMERMDAFGGVAGCPRSGGDGRVGRFFAPAHSAGRGILPPLTSLELNREGRTGGFRKITTGGRGKRRD